MRRLFNALGELLENKEPAVLVTVIASSGSTPRGTGARMLMGKAGRICGTIGGGAVEYKSEQLAMETLEDGVSHIESFTLAPNEVADLGMICGGDVTVFFQYIAPDSGDILELCRMVEARFQENQSTWLVTELSGTGATAMGLYDGATLTGIEGDPADFAVVRERGAGRHRIEGRNVYVERIIRGGRVYIFGGGHVAQELVPVLARVEFSCVVLDDRPRFADKALFPDADDVLVGDFEKIGDSVTITGDDYVVIMTRGHRHDTDVEKQALRTPARYIGVIGSRHKIAAVNKKLMAEGFTQEDLDRVNTPIGLAIKAETPAEIAISIAAEMILKRAEGSR